MIFHSYFIALDLFMDSHYVIVCFPVPFINTTVPVLLLTKLGTPTRALSPTNKVLFIFVLEGDR